VATLRGHRAELAAWFHGRSVRVVNLLPRTGELIATAGRLAWDLNPLAGHKASTLQAEQDWFRVGDRVGVLAG
jgi:hypothetical protein